MDDYKCYCHAGFVGRNCEHNVNDCVTNPCANGGTCHDSINDFVCTCRPGYTGKDCSHEVNECATSPCMHGFCIDKMNDFECKCLPGYSGKHCNILPDGTVLKLTGEPEDMDNLPLIITFSVLIPCMVVFAVIYLMCNKRRQRLDQEKADEEAKRENELNAGSVVGGVNKAKMLNIVNTLDFPPQKSVNTNPNITDEELFKAKDSSYSRSKQLNTDCASSSYTLSSRASMLCEKLDNSSVVSGASNSPNSSPSARPFLSAYPAPHHHQSSPARRGLHYENVSSAASTVSSHSGTSSVCSR